MPIPFPTATPNVPILGQQILVEGYTLAITARCQCEPSGTLIPLTVTVSTCGTLTAPTACPKCARAYGIQGMQLDPQGRLMFAVAVMTTSPPISQ